MQSRFADPLAMSLKQDFHRVLSLSSDLVTRDRYAYEIVLAEYFFTSLPRIKLSKGPPLLDCSAASLETRHRQLVVQPTDRCQSDEPGNVVTVSLVLVSKLVTEPWFLRKWE